MKPRVLALLRASFVMLILATTATPAHADAAMLTKAIGQLEAAKKSSDPMTLLESAKDLLINAKKGNKEGDRDEAVAKVQEAIDDLKAGDKKKMNKKINAAIANIRQGKDKAKP